MPWNGQGEPLANVADDIPIGSGGQPFVPAVPAPDYDPAFSPPQAYQSPPFPLNFNLSPQQTPEQELAGIEGETSVCMCAGRLLWY